MVSNSISGSNTQLANKPELNIITNINKEKEDNIKYIGIDQLSVLMVKLTEANTNQLPDLMVKLAEANTNSLVISVLRMYKTPFGFLQPNVRHHKTISVAFPIVFPRDF